MAESATLARASEPESLTIDVPTSYPFPKDQQGLFQLRPRAARAWSAGLQDGARWHFAAL